MAIRDLPIFERNNNKIMSENIKNSKKFQLKYKFLNYQLKHIQNN